MASLTQGCRANARNGLILTTKSPGTHHKADISQKLFPD